MKTFTHRFVETMPDVLEESVLYVSLRYGIVSHRCACGCGEEVVVKLSPTDWQLTYDGESISLFPSIGNWGLKCRSHYWLKNNRAEWAAQWSDTKIRNARIANARNNRREDPRTASSSPGVQTSHSTSFWNRLRRNFRKH